MVGKELEADLTQHPVLITEAATADKKQREKMTEVTIVSFLIVSQLSHSTKTKLPYLNELVEVKLALFHISL